MVEQRAVLNQSEYEQARVDRMSDDEYEIYLKYSILNGKQFLIEILRDHGEISEEEFQKRLESVVNGRRILRLREDVLVKQHISAKSEHFSTWTKDGF